MELLVKEFIQECTANIPISAAERHCVPVFKVKGAVKEQAFDTCQF